LAALNIECLADSLAATTATFRRNGLFPKRPKYFASGANKPPPAPI
jgi:hypothetical protein